MGSIWQKESVRTCYPSLKGEIFCDAAVVGGGLCGVLCAYKLTKAGLNTVLLEKNSLASGQSANSTAKVTLAMGTVLSDIAGAYGKRAAAAFARGIDEAVNEYGSLVAEEGLCCGFEKLPCSLYSLHDKKLLMRESSIAAEVGIKYEMGTESALPFKTAGTLRYNNSAQFDPIALISALAERITVYENTNVIGYKKGRVICENGAVNARYTVIATNYPAASVVHGIFPFKLHRRMAHVCAFSGTEKLQEMYVGADGGYNYRAAGDKLIVSGESHVSGSGKGGAYERIESNTKANFKNARTVMNWCAEDSESTDHLPYVGRLGNKGELYFAGGFGTWGTALSMVSSDIIRDLICGNESELAPLFSPKRFSLSASGDELFKTVSRAVNGIVLSKIRPTLSDLSDLKEGCAGIVMHMGRKTGAYLDTEGKLHLIDPVCPHKKCELRWNSDDLTWDCPCHGSRFDIDGNLITGPAERKLK